MYIAGFSDGVANTMMISVKFDERDAVKAELAEKGLEYDDRSNVAMDEILEKKVERK